MNVRYIRKNRTSASLLSFPLERLSIYNAFSFEYGYFNFHSFLFIVGWQKLQFLLTYLYTIGNVNEFSLFSNFWHNLDLKINVKNITTHSAVLWYWWTQTPWTIVTSEKFMGVLRTNVCIPQSLFQVFFPSKKFYPDVFSCQSSWSSFSMVIWTKSVC